MHESIITEVKLRSLKLESQEKSNSAMDALELRLSRLYVQKHETINGVKRKITKQRRIALGYALIDKYLDNNLDITEDTLNQLKGIDNGSS